VARDESGRFCPALKLSGSHEIAEYNNGAAVSSPSQEFIYTDAVPGSGLLASVTGGSTLTYFHSDHLGTARSIAEVPSGQTAATKCYDAGLYPYGGERWYTDTCDSHYKFTGKECDSSL
jgi:hypothetical protein